MARSTLFSVLFLISCTAKRNTVTSDQTADSVIKNIQSHIQPSINQIKYEVAIKYLDSIYPQIHAFNHDGIMSSWLRYKGATLMLNEQYDSANAYLRQSHLIAQKGESPNTYLIKAKTELANCFVRQRIYDSALIYGLDAYQLGQRIDTSSIPRICTVLVYVYEILNDTANRAKYLFEGYRRSTDPENKLVLTNNILRYYFEKGQMDSGMIYFNKVNEDSLLKTNLKYQISNMANMGTLLSQQGSLAEGATHLKSALHLAKENNSVDEKMYVNLAQNYFMQGDYTQSSLYIDTALSLGRSNDNYDVLSTAYGFLSDIEFARNRNREAYRALDSSYLYHYKNDSISFVEKASELETRYAVKAKDEKISNLAFQNATNNKIRNQQKVIITSMIIGVALLIATTILIWKRRQIRMELKEFELKQRLLRTQMDSHFLFSSLNTLKDSIRHEQPDKSINYLTKFSRLIRLGLQNAQNNFVTLKDEVAAIEDYLSLQAANFDHRFNYQIDIYDGYENDNILIPPMLIQPFIENSILHGISKLSHEGYVHIKIQKKQTSIHCTIEDNGKGLATSAVLENKRSLSTTITQDRLDILRRQTGSPAKLNIVDKQDINEGQGVRVTLLIPYRPV